ncbi:MAG: hypothetical protein ACLQK4_12745 [Acidimicrobiales bacterium]
MQVVDDTHDTADSSGSVPFVGSVVVSTFQVLPFHCAAKLTYSLVAK